MNEHLDSKIAFYKSLEKLVKNFNDYKKDIKKNMGNLILLRTKFQSKLKGNDLIDYQISDMKALYDELNNIIISSSDDYFNTFGNQLQKMIDSKYKLLGQFPVFHIDIFTIEVKPELSKIELWIGYREELVNTIRLEINELANFILEHEKYCSSFFKEESFLDSFSKAFDYYSYFNREVYLPELMPFIIFLSQEKSFRLNPLKKNYKEYPRYKFIYDIYRFREIVSKKFIIVPSTRSVSNDKSKSIFIPEPNSHTGSRYSQVDLRTSKGA